VESYTPYLKRHPRAGGDPGNINTNVSPKPLLKNNLLRHFGIIPRTFYLFFAFDFSDIRSNCVAANNRRNRPSPRD
jgi:hypothetical protein